MQDCRGSVSEAHEADGAPRPSHGGAPLHGRRGDSARGTGPLSPPDAWQEHEPDRLFGRPAPGPGYAGHGNGDIGPERLPRTEGHRRCGLRRDSAVFGERLLAPRRAGRASPRWSTTRCRPGTRRSSLAPTSAPLRPTHRCTTRRRPAPAHDPGRRIEHQLLDRPVVLGRSRRAERAPKALHPAASPSPNNSTQISPGVRADRRLHAPPALPRPRRARARSPTRRLRTRATRAAQAPRRTPARPARPRPGAPPARACAARAAAPAARRRSRRSSRLRAPARSRRFRSRVHPPARSPACERRPRTPRAGARAAPRSASRHLDLLFQFRHH